MKTESEHWNIVWWVFCLIFFVLGILNVILVHIVPGAIYILLAFLYLPWTNTFIKKRLGFSIPPVLKLILGLIVLWGTLAVGDLMEIIESQYL